MVPQEPIDEVPLRIENLILDLQRRGLYRGTERVHLTPKPFGVLSYLVRNRGKVVSKDELLRAVWKGHHNENTVEVAIRQIRLALGDDTERPRFIQTIPGEGYCFIAPVDARHRRPEEPALDPRNSERASFFRAAREHWQLGIVACVSVLLVLALTVGIFRTTSLPEPRAVNPIRITRSQSRILSPLVTDGARLYYQRFVNGHYEVAEVAASGGEAAAPSIGISNPELCDISPDGNALLLRNLTHSREDNEPVYIQPLIAGPLRRIPGILAYDVAWYPDGKHILYSANGVVYSTDLEAKSPRRLFAVQGNAYWFRWAPDSRSIRFTVLDAKTEATSLWEASVDGTVRRAFPEFQHQQCCGSWTRDGKYFVFQVRVENTFQIWARPEHGGIIFRTNQQPVPLIAGAVNYRGPLLSADGRKLYVRADAPKGQLVRYDSRSRQFITLLPSISARTIAYSKDGEWIAYTSLADNNLWRCKVDGTGCLQLTQGMQQTVLPRWSPDGQRIAFMGRHFGGNWGIFTIASTGENLQALSPDSRSDGDPDWSPDGQQLVFGNVLESPEDRAIYILDLRIHKVTALPGSKGYFSPRWSPDGRFIVAMRSDNQHLDTFELALRRWQNLTQVAAGYPSWSHDGNYVYFVSAAGRNRTIFRIGIRDRVLEPIANLADIERGPFIMGDWVGLGPDDSPIAVRNLTTEDIYSWDLTAR